jgi:hypothetical protein
VVAVCVALVVCWISVTVAPGITAPELSLTTPDTKPVVADCPYSKGERSRASKEKQVNNRNAYLSGIGSAPERGAKNSEYCQTSQGEVVFWFSISCIHIEYG